MYSMLTDDYVLLIEPAFYSICTECIVLWQYSSDYLTSFTSSAVSRMLVGIRAALAIWGIFPGKIYHGRPQSPMLV